MAKISLASQLIGEKRYESLILFGLQEKTFLRLLAAFVVIGAIFYPCLLYTSPSPRDRG